jgi:hypothetical protein
MTKEEMKRMIEGTAQASRDAGATIEINQTLPYVAIKQSDGAEYFFQEHEASELLDEHESIASLFDVSLEDSILHDAQGW